MTLSVQTKANRANAQKSTGPSSQNGKAIVGKNAIKHGIHSQVPILSHEDPQVFETLTEELYEELAPATTMEREMVDRIIMTLIRQRRLREAETASIQLSIDQSTPPKAKKFRIDDQYETLEKELKAIDYQINRCTPKALKEKAPHVYANVYAEPRESLSAAQAFTANILFQSLLNKVNLYTQEKSAVRHHQQNEAHLRACQLLPNTPEMHFLTRYQVQLDHELIRLLKLYHNLQAQRQQREVIVVD